MKKKSTALVICAAVPVAAGGGIGFYRSSLIEKWSDPSTGRLLIGSAGNFRFFFIAAALCALLCFALAFSVRRVPLIWGLRPISTRIKTARVLAAFLLFAAAVFLLLNAESLSVLILLKSVFLVACGGACIAFIRVQSFSGKGMCALFPLFFMSIYLLSFYRDSARNPLIYTFAFEILTVIALLLALYLSCCPWFGKKRPGLLLFFAMLATFGAAACAVTGLLSKTFARLYLPAGLADVVLAFALLLWVWTDIFESAQPLPPQSAPDTSFSLEEQETDAPAEDADGPFEDLSE